MIRRIKHQSWTLILIIKLIRRTPGYTLFPYTTLFRSRGDADHPRGPARPVRGVLRGELRVRTLPRPADAARRPGAGGTRSEEHTSELQSPVHLVCRLLLEKKKSTNEYTHEYLRVTSIT